tara:strand:+ start:196 stop:951 length:756 start_codon:yes stop_codon:yes gene_type:complete
MNQRAENMLFTTQRGYTRPTEGTEYMRIKRNIGYWTKEKLQALSPEELEEWRIANRIGPLPDRYGQIVPWFNPDAIDWLIDYLPKNKGLKVLDFGCGGTTIFTSNYTDNMISIDHPTTEWFDDTTSEGVCACECYCVSPARCGRIRTDKIKLWMSVVNPEYNLDIRLRTGESYYSCDEFEDNYFDLIYIDGEYRKQTFINSLSKLKSGGWIFIDNVPDQIKFDQEMINAAEGWEGFKSTKEGPGTWWFQKP